MEVKAICPASCGELIQGIIGDGEKLISYGVDLYTHIQLKEEMSKVRHMSLNKCYRALEKTIDYFNEDKSILDNINVYKESQIPIAKGMASSTADMAATIVAMCSMINRKITEEELAQICVSVEPTDSTIFKELTLFDHLNGRKIENFSWVPNVSVLILEPSHILETQKFRKLDYNYLRNKNKEKIKRAYDTFTQAYKNKDISLLGKASEYSALANEIILKKSKLKEIMDLSTKLGCAGVNVAHSGTVVGVLYEESKVDEDKLLFSFKESFNREYEKIYTTKLVEGGVRII
ncbi:GHMP family kinase ATP-binding protein [Anaeromicrobium sediminis]|uniref:GHMP kinase N-terminal domain-containing protein n=1 Tax=Anaeromicrobium sediminis TaxID=1478221 RepID=A0A267MMY9_9FIRM|nr:propanediol utilization protein [Anaeromicrobium sediminis]PAB60772.1 hypothetical protein CCE28_04330 [Anaeromicrobium sediminis]